MDKFVDKFSLVLPGLWSRFCKNEVINEEKYSLGDFLIKADNSQIYDPSLIHVFGNFMNEIGVSVRFKLIGEELDEETNEVKLHTIDGVFNDSPITVDTVIVLIATYINNNYITYNLKLLSDIDLNKFSRELSEDYIDVEQHHNSINMKIFELSENDENIEIKLCI